MAKEWLQIRGDPSIRQFLFEQERTVNEFDKSIDTGLNRACELLHHHGVLHAKVHFSSGRLSLWLVDDPMRVRGPRVSALRLVEFDQRDRGAELLV